MSKRKLTKKLDREWSKKVKERANYKCEYCLRGDLRLNSCHIIGRRYRGVRWDLENGMCLCVHHHMQYDQHGPEAKNIFDNLIGDDLYEKLRRKATEITKLSLDEMERMYEGLKAL